ncbi:Phage tail-collar fibre protein [Ralstonia sp. 25mfcol4.1]|uniref:phage tail protein n=1 Tax=Ralstonia sp. 25mfcol4.1 TaxID=1761899 RepID=UPI000888D684|nr:phage tail protein [Ralstonia sp. 25mfcol4.1]SDP46069.1 Phage tail-collar fibre protein [Ralstonia sp. 25mfcol4.1]
MAQTYFLIPTADGEAKLANAQALGVPLKLTAMSVGDANGALPIPDRARKTLINERRRAAINSLTQDPQNASQFIAEQVIPETEGGWWIREAGLHAEDGTLVYYANIPETYKPVLAEGSARTQVVRLVCLNTSGATVELKVDPSIVLATRGYVDTQIAAELDKRDGKQSALVATTAPLAALSGLQTVDGVVLTVGARVLVKDQVAGKDNGIYAAATGAWARTADADSGIDLTPGALVTIEQGTVNGDSVWQLATDGTIIIGATALVFKRVGDGYFAPLASPDFTGVPKVDTAPPGTATRQAASTAFVAAAIAALVNASPAQLDTLNELAAALGNDANFAATMTAALALKAPLASPDLTGNPTAPTQAQFDASKKLATMEAVQRALGNFSGSASFTATANVPVANAGKMISVAMVAAGQVLTLPALNAAPDGATFVFQNVGGQAFNVARAGTDWMTASGTALGAVTVYSGETAVFVKASNGWLCSGSAAEQLGANWARYHITNGYQRFPGGLILNWGSFQCNAVSGGITAFSYALRFPNYCLMCTGNRQAPGTNATLFVSTAGGDPTGQVIAQNFAASPEWCSFIALGF